VRIDEAHDGQRIDNFLLGQLKGVPKSLVYRILRTGQVRINGKRTKPDVRIADGDEVRIASGGESVVATAHVRTGVPAGSAFLSGADLAAGPAELNSAERVPA